MEGEFWICLVNSLDKDFYSDWPSPDESCEGLGHHVDVGNIRVKVVWDDKGAKVNVYQSDGQNDLVLDLWKTKKTDMKKLFWGQDVDLEHLAENLQTITVEISDLPVSWLIGSKLHEKMEIAEMFHKNYSKMVDFVNDATIAAERDR